MSTMKESKIDKQPFFSSDKICKKNPLLMYHTVMFEKTGINQSACTRQNFAIYFLSQVTKSAWAINYQEMT